MKSNPMHIVIQTVAVKSYQSKTPKTCGTEIKGILTLTNSANIDEPERVITKLDLEKYFKMSVVKLKI